ncbi:hypothetical protein I204_07917 [Kwoniella mangroviensis CBS 8886]|nr:hypothetical protein I204_07917 [Kwoniella mangroviensis CBS 8886]
MSQIISSVCLSCAQSILDFKKDYDLRASLSNCNDTQESDTTNSSFKSDIIHHTHCQSGFDLTIKRVSPNDQWLLVEMRRSTPDDGYQYQCYHIRKSYPDLERMEILNSASASEAIEYLNVEDIERAISNVSS